MRTKAKNKNISKVINSIQIPPSNAYKNLNINLNIYNGGACPPQNQINIVSTSPQQRKQKIQDAYNFKPANRSIQVNKNKNTTESNKIDSFYNQKPQMKLKRPEKLNLKAQLEESEDQQIYTDNPLQLYQNHQQFYRQKNTIKQKLSSNQRSIQQPKKFKTVDYYIPKKRYQQHQQQNDQYLQLNKRRYFSRDSYKKQGNQYKDRNSLQKNNNFMQAFRKDRSLGLRKSKITKFYTNFQPNKDYAIERNITYNEKEASNKSQEKSPYLVNNRYSLTHQQKRQSKGKEQSIRNKFRKSLTKEQIGNKSRNLHTQNQFSNTISNSSSKSIKFGNLRITQHLKSQNSNSKEFKASHETIQDQIKQSHQIYRQKQVEKAKQYFSLGLYKESIEILQKVLSSEPNNLESLYISAMCLLNGKNYKRCLKYLNKAIQIDEKFNRMCYILSAICENKLNINNYGRIKLLKCIKLFPQFQQAYIYLGKLDYQTKRFNEGIQYLEKARKINPQKLQTLINLASCYYAVKNFDKCSYTYQQIIKMLLTHKKQQKPELRQEINFQSFNKQANNKGQVIWYYEKLIILLVQHANQYQKAVKISNQCINYCKNLQKGQSKKRNYQNPLVYYLLAFSQFKLKKYSQASMTLQILINSSSSQIILQSSRNLDSKKKVYNIRDFDASQYLFESICLLVSIKIVHSDYYEACHILDRINHLTRMQDHTNNPQIKQINLFKNFCQGVVCLMKRKIQDGINFLQRIRSDINSNGGYIHGSKKLKPKSTLNAQAEEAEYQVRTWVKLQMFNIIKRIYHMYVSFGYFCKSDFKRCKQQIKKQFSINLQQKYNDTLNYNLELSQGILFFKEKKYQQSINKFNTASKRYPRKPQPYLYAFICKTKLFYNCQNIINQKQSNSQQEKKQTKQAILDKNMLEQQMANIINQCCDIVNQMNNNCGANVFFHRSVFKAYFRKWSEALQDIDQAIQRSQENYWRFYYVRGLVLACCHNFKQAINQLTVAITLNQKFAKLYLVRSKCLQIDGDCNQAFLDLQSYISLEPQDSSIHKYAGHLLFQNGAFQDAILAYSHGQIPLEEQNFDVFLTRSKTYFLIGKFQEAKRDMQMATTLKPTKKEINFDCKIVEIISLIVQTIPLLQNLSIQETQKRQEGLNEDKKINREILLQIQRQLNDIYQKDGVANNFKYGKIFKPIQQNLLNATIQFYLKNYEQAIKQFKQCIKNKQLSFMNKSNQFLNGTIAHKNNQNPPIDNIQSEANEYAASQEPQSQFEQQQNERRIYVNQMFFNLTICYLMEGNYEQAEKMLEKCNISSQSKIYENYYKFKLIVRGELDVKQLKALNQQISLQKSQQSSSQEQHTFQQVNLEDSATHLNNMNKSNSQFCKSRQGSELFKKKQREDSLKIKQKSKPYDYIEVFSLNNKLSNFLPLFKVPSRIQNQQFWMKLCIPFPKVEPPQIFPTFDEQIMKQFDVNNVDTKPQAPWIQRQDNAIKFTDKIQVFSRLQIQKSEVSQHIKKETLMKGIDADGGMQLESNSFQQSSIEIGQNLKQRLKLDAGIQDKLNKLLKKNKNQK